MYDSVNSQVRDVSLNDGQFLPEEERLLREDGDPASPRWSCRLRLGGGRVGKEGERDGGRKRSGSMFTNGMQSALRVVVDVSTHLLLALLGCTTTLLGKRLDR